MSKPDYIRHQLSEDQITIDWLFTSKKTGHRLRQLVLIGIGWVMCLIPTATTVGIYLTRETIIPVNRVAFKQLLQNTNYIFLRYIIVFSIFFISLYLMNKVKQYRIRKGIAKTFDEQRLQKRLAWAEEMYTAKYGAASIRKQRQNIIIPDFADVGTYELRQRFDAFEGKTMISNEDQAVIDEMIARERTMKERQKIIEAMTHKRRVFKRRLVIVCAAVLTIFLVILYDCLMAYEG
ncbi:hypothetical protein QY884_05090 [Latilactobacillus sakei]